MLDRRILSPRENPVCDILQRAREEIVLIRERNRIDFDETKFEYNHIYVHQLAYI